MYLDEKRKLIINNGGFTSGSIFLYNSFLQIYKAEIKLCEMWIKRNTKPISKPTASSYEYKHKVEKDLFTYIPNGAFIQAGINLGYKYQEAGMNAIFYFK